MKLINRLDRWHKTPKGHLTFGVLEIVLAYILLSIALDTASMWVYLGGILMLIGGLRNLIRVFSAPHPNVQQKGKVKNVRHDH